MKFLMTAAFLSVFAMGAADANPMMRHGEHPMMMRHGERPMMMRHGGHSLAREHVQNYHYYFGTGCPATCAPACDPCAVGGTMVGDVVGGVVGGPARMVRGVGGMFY